MAAATPVAQQPAESEAFQALLLLAEGRTGRIRADALVRHVRSVAGQAGWPNGKAHIDLGVTARGTRQDIEVRGAARREQRPVGEVQQRSVGVDPMEQRLPRTIGCGDLRHEVAEAQSRAEQPRTVKGNPLTGVLVCVLAKPRELAFARPIDDRDGRHAGRCEHVGLAGARDGCVSRRVSPAALPRWWRCLSSSSASSPRRHALPQHHQPQAPRLARAG